MTCCDFHATEKFPKQRNVSLHWSDSWSLIMIKWLSLGWAPEIWSGLKQNRFRIPHWPSQSVLCTHSLKHSTGVLGFVGFFRGFFWLLVFLWEKTLVSYPFLDSKFWVWCQPVIKKLVPQSGHSTRVQNTSQIPHWFFVLWTRPRGINELQSSMTLSQCFITVLISLTNLYSFRIETTITSNREAFLGPASCLEQKKRNERKLPVLN